MATTIKNLGNRNYNPLNSRRIIVSYTFTVDDSGADVLDASAVVEIRDSVTAELVDTKQISRRFTQTQMETAVTTIPNFPTYDQLRNGLAKLVHTLIENNP